MAGNKKPRKPKKSFETKMIGARASRIAAQEQRNRENERAHSIRQFAALNEPMTQERCDYSFKPLEDAVFDIERTGEGHIDQDGHYIFLPHPEEGIWYSLPAALDNACEVFERIGNPADVAPLRKIAERLTIRMPLFAENMTMTPNEFIALIEETDHA
jgi:hypothetical protein